MDTIKSAKQAGYSNCPIKKRGLILEREGSSSRENTAYHTRIKDHRLIRFGEMIKKI